MPSMNSLATRARKPGRPNKSQVDASLDIRKAALKAFARGGFHGVSIVEIARMASVAKPLVYYHYASKDVLWEAAVGDAVAELRAQVVQFQAALTAPASAPDLLRRVARQLVLFASRHPQLVHIVVDETAKGGARADWLRAHLLTPGYAMGKTLLEGLARLAGTRTPAVEHLVPMVLGIMNFPFMVAFSQEHRSYLALYCGLGQGVDESKHSEWATDHMKTLELWSKGIQLADENLARRPAKFLSDAKLARLDQVRAKYDPKERFHPWMGRLA